MKRSIANILYEAQGAESQLEDSLFQAGVTDFDRLSWDHYDNSLEIYGVAPSLRLSPEAQRVISDAGFSKVYVNHIDKWETHYSLWPLESLPVKGWRVSYPHKRGPEEKGIWVESEPCKWPKEWFETGYAIVKDSTP